MSTDDGDRNTTRITREGQVTVPKELREEFDLESGDELVWQRTEDGIRVTKATQSAGRGMLVDDDVSAETREEMARELASAIRDRRQTEWQP